MSKLDFAPNSKIKHRGPEKESPSQGLEVEGSFENRAVPRHQSESQIICRVELDREGLDLPPGVLAPDADYENV